MGGGRAGRGWAGRAAAGRAEDPPASAAPRSQPAAAGWRAGWAAVWAGWRAPRGRRAWTGALARVLKTGDVEGREEERMDFGQGPRERKAPLSRSWSRPRGKPRAPGARAPSESPNQGLRRGTIFPCKAQTGCWLAREAVKSPQSSSEGETGQGCGGGADSWL